MNIHSFLGKDMIENKNRNKEEDKSIAVAEESREADWKSKSFMASIFMGDLDVSMCFPFPEQDAEDRAIGDQWLIAEGLQAGDRLIVEGIQKVRPGQEVEILSDSENK